MAAPGPSSGSRTALALAVCLGAAGPVACGGDGAARDASTRPALALSVLSVRFEAQAGAAPTGSLTAFRAATVGLDAESVLALVDPFAQPASRAGCEIRDLDAAGRALDRQRGSVALEDMPGVELELPASTTVLRPTARLYPDLGTAISGVLGESGAVEIAEIPGFVTLTERDYERAALELVVPEAPSIESVTRLGNGDLEVVFGDAGATMEFRPFGHTRSLSCAMPADGRLVVPAALIRQMLPVRGGLEVAVSIDAVRRELRRASLGNEPVLVSVEVRSEVVRELTR